MSLILFATLLASAQQDAPVTESAACLRVTRAAEQARPQLPAMIDEVTRLDDIQVDCAAKTYVMLKSVIADYRYIHDGWEARTRQELQDIVCKSSLRGIERLGWRFTETLRFPGGETFTLVVKCP